MKLFATLFCLIPVSGCLDYTDLKDSIIVYGETKKCFSDVEEITVVDGDHEYSWGNAVVVIGPFRRKAEFASRKKNGKFITYSVNICP